MPFDFKYQRPRRRDHNHEHELPQHHDRRLPRMDVDAAVRVDGSNRDGHEDWQRDSNVRRIPESDDRTQNFGTGTGNTLRPVVNPVAHPQRFERPDYGSRSDGEE